MAAYPEPPPVIPSPPSRIHRAQVTPCVSLFYVIDTGSIRPRARILGGTELGVAYLPSTISSDAGYADLPLPLLGASVSIEALVKLGSRSLAKQDRD